MPSDAAVNLQLHPRQTAAFQSKATEILYGGAAGGGKSHLMRSAAIGFCASIPGLQVYIFRRISDDLIKNHIEGPNGFRAMLAPWVQGKLVEIVEGEIRFWNGAKIYLCHCEYEKDRFKYQGAEIHVLLIDELTTFTEVIYRFLRSRVRMVGMEGKVPRKMREAFPRIICGSNPGNLGHHWVKQTFVDGCLPMQKRRMPKEEGGMLRQYIPAKLDDNPSMVANDPSYGDRLEGLGHPELVRAMRDGDWDVVLGAFFPEWRREKHVTGPLTPPSHWTVFGSFDWGSARPFSFGLWTVSNGEALPDGRIFPVGALIRWREWYGMQAGHPNVGLYMSNADIGAGIRARIEALKERGIRCSYIAADPSIFKEDGGPSIAEQMKVPLLMKADNTRVPGWSQVRGRLIGMDGKPYLYITSDCHDSVRTLPAVVGDSIKFDDVDSDGEDHAPDEIRYACQSRPWVRPLQLVKPTKVDPRVPTFSEAMTAHDIVQDRRRRI